METKTRRKDGFKFVADDQGRRDLARHRTLVWFIDQTCREITNELAISQEYYRLCTLHLIAESGDDLDVMDRTWCLWETGRRAYENKRSQIMEKLKVKVHPPAG
jgi:hypothetical protein